MPMSQGEHIFRSRKGCKLQLVEVHITLAKVNKLTPTGTEFSNLHTFPELIFPQFRCIEHAMFWVEDTLDNECKYNKICSRILHAYNIYKFQTETNVYTGIKTKFCTSSTNIRYRMEQARSERNHR
jgi:hypothetical protein